MLRKLTAKHRYFPAKTRRQLLSRLLRQKHLRRHRQCDREKLIVVDKA